ncbi:MAG: ATP-binding protein [Candidatus Shapirobacteria bacterium]|jgi:phosphotransferase system IIA component
MNLLNKFIKKPEEKVFEIKPKENKKPFSEGLVSTKDIIAPSSLEVDFNYIRIDNKYYRTLFVAGYPRFVGINWLSYLINFDATLSLSMYIYPTDGKAILDDLRRKITEMEAELSSDIQRGRLVNPATQAKLEDAMNLQADLVKGEERFFQFGLYITISADSKEELERINKNLEAALGSLLIVSKRATLQMEEGFITGLPIGSDKLNVTRNMDTTSLATTFPFVSSDLSDDKGIIYGINAHNGSLIIFDRFSMQNYNSVVFATAGAGKSYMIKLEVLRSLMLGTEIIVIDPENEYRDLAESVGGQYIAFGYGEASKINPFDLSLVEEEGENALNSKILSVHKLLKVMLGAMDPIEESILDKAMMDAYKMKGITPDPTTQNREPPLIEDLYKSLIGMEEEKAKSLAARLEKYIKGSFAGIFNQKTTVNLTNPFVVFGIKNLEDTLRPVAMHIILDYIWTIVKKTLKKRILVVDEAWYLMQYEDSASFLRGIVKRGRKYYLGVTTITQDVDDFLATPYGKEIVTNSAIQILLKQHTAAIDQIGKVFYLSEGEKQLLLTADKGQGIFFAGQNHVAINIISSEEEHQLITSNPEDVLKKQPIVKFNQEKLKEIEKPVIDTAVVVENKEVIVVNKEPEIIQPQETTNDVLQRKIGELEEKEKQDLINYNEIPKELSGEIPIKNQDLPPLPKFEPPKAEVITTEDNKKPIFIKTEETQISQPPQLNKKTQPVFETTKSPIPAELPSLDSLSLKTTDEKINGDQKNTEEIKKPEDTNKMDYDKLFGNGIV